MKDPLKPRDKVTQKMSRDGLIEVNETKETAERISRREQETDYTKQPEQPQDMAQQLHTQMPEAVPVPSPGIYPKHDTATAERVMEHIGAAQTRQASKKAVRKAQEEATASGRSSRLQFTDEELSTPELEKYIKNSDKAADRLDAARAAIPKEKVLVRSRTFDEATGKGKTRLHFEEREKPMPDWKHRKNPLSRPMQEAGVFVHNKIGELCSAFEIMRKTLLDNNRQLWRQTEERKRLNVAFSHDLRNPVTVLKGSAKLLQKGIDNGTLNADNSKESVELICQYAGRIERYIELMTNAQKLEELECKRQTYDRDNIQSELKNSLMILSEASGKKIKITNSGTAEKVTIDKQFVYNTAENLISNALRYAKSEVTARIDYGENQMILSICDDGNGFPPAILKKGIAPFSRSEISDSEHFGMGLYICKLLCKKHGGDLQIENTDHGAKATAIFNF